jgi:phage shock protein A
MQAEKIKQLEQELRDANKEIERLKNELAKWMLQKWVTRENMNGGYRVS